MKKSVNSTNIKEVAADTNPEATARRDAVCLTHTDKDTNSYLIKKVSIDYSRIQMIYEDEFY